MVVIRRIVLVTTILVVAGAINDLYNNGYPESAFPWVVEHVPARPFAIAMYGILWCVIFAFMAMEREEGEQSS